MAESTRFSPIVVFLLILILAMSAYLRLTYLNWDEGQHIHPDERFLTMVVTALSIPESLIAYFNTETSPLNPYNNNFGSFVYGTFPIFFLKVVGDLVQKSGYGEVHLIGRFLSGLFDCLTVLVIFFIGRKLYDVWTALFAALLMGTTVIHIQQSHFFVVDTFLTFFVVFAVYEILRAIETQKVRYFILAGLSLGTALACKITAGFLCLPIMIVTLFLIGKKRSWAYSWRLVGKMALIAVFMVIAFRVFQPYAFSGPTIFDIHPSSKFLDDIRQISRLSSGELDYPPGHQWTRRTPYLFPLYNLLFWGMGIFSGAAAVIGLGFMARRIWLRKDPLELLCFLWTVLYFLYMGGRFAMTLRYFMPIAPFLQLAGAAACVEMYRTLNRNPQGWIRHLSPLALYVVGIGTVCFGFAYYTIYQRPLTRMSASKWIYTHVSPRVGVANEHWDDAIPFSIGPLNSSRFTGYTLTPYDEDSPEKVTKMLDVLAHVDYIFITSNRLYQSIPRLPMRFPMTVKYYQYLFSGELGFDLVRVFTSYPTIFGLSLVDDNAEEIFSVYDHPKVLIFKKTDRFDLERAKSLLSNVDWSAIRRIRPIEASREDYEIPNIQPGMAPPPEPEPELEGKELPEPPPLPTPPPVNLFNTAFGSWNSFVNQPRSAAVDSKGNIYISDFRNFRVQKFDPAGEFLLTWGKEGSFEGEFKDPTGITIDRQNRIYVADTWNHRIQVFDPDGKFITILGANAGLYGPRDVAVGENGTVYVTDSGNRRICVFSPEGNLLHQFTTKIHGEKELSFPIGIEIYKNKVYVLDAGIREIHIFNLEGSYLRSLNLSPFFGEPLKEGDLVISDKGEIFVSSAVQNRVARLDLKGELLSEFTGGSQKEFSFPTGLTLTKDKRLLVVDTNNHLVQYVDLSSEK